MPQKWDRASVLVSVKAFGNTVNLLAFRYLWPADDADADDAWCGLVGCCWRAKGSLFVVPPEDRNTSILVETQDFIHENLLNELAPYKRMTQKKIAEIAVVGKFKYIARTIRNRMVDRVRKVYRSASKPEPVAPFEPTVHDQLALLVSLRAEQDRIANELGRGSCEALIAVATAWPVSRSLRQRKGKVTSAISVARGVSHRQARKDRAKLLYGIFESNYPFLIGLRTSAWFRYVFNLTSGSRFHFDEIGANGFLIDEPKTDGIARSR